jgi:type IV pilus assembly protein PilO
MELSLSKLPWYGQIGAFVAVCVGALFGFWKFYVVEMQADIVARQTRLTALRADIAKGVATARRLPQFQADVTQLEQRLENLRAVLPEEKDVADILRRVQGLAAQSNVNIQRFTPQEPKQEALYASLPYKVKAEGNYHNLGLFFDRISKFPRIINVGDITIKAKQTQDPAVSIDAEYTATTFVLQESKGPATGGRGGGRGVVPKQPSAPAK